MNTTTISLSTTITTMNIRTTQWKVTTTTTTSNNKGINGITRIIE